MNHNGNGQKVAYICGPLTNLSADLQKSARALYERIADLCAEVMGQRAFVPHEHYDPIKHASFTPAQVDEAERHQVCQHTSVMVVVAVGDSWGGGIEVEMANTSGVPVIILHAADQKVSRLLRGNPAVVGVITCTSESDALFQLRNKLESLSHVFA